MILAIAAFLAGGIAARSQWSAAHVPVPPGAPARDTVQAPEEPPEPAPSASPSHRRTAHHPARHQARHPARTRPAAVAGLPAEQIAVRGVAYGPHQDAGFENRPVSSK